MAQIKDRAGNRRAMEYETGCNNLYQTLWQSAQRYPHKIAAVDAGGSMTYKEILRRVDVLAGYLAKQVGIAPGDNASILQENRTDFCISFYALLKIGCTVAVLNTKQSPLELKNLLGVVRPRCLILNACWTEKILPALEATDVGYLLFTETEKEVERWTSLADLSCEYACLPAVIAQPQVLTEPMADQDTPALLLFTSGVTGTPKGVLLSHRNLLQSVASYADSLRLGPEEVTVLSVPVFHVTGLICVMALFVYLGGRIVYLPRFQAAETLRMMEEHKATHFHAVATVYLLLEKELLGTGARYDLPAFHMAVCGGGAISEATIHTVKQILPGLSFQPAYGLTETAGAGVVFPQDYDSAGKPQATGQVMQTAHITIRNEQNICLPIGEIGEICIEGPIVTGGYLGRKPLPDGVLHTGDIGRLDSDGYLYVLDRIKDMINRGGEKVYSIEIERLITAMPEVYRCALFGVPHPLYGEVPVLAVVPAEEKTLKMQQVQAFLQGKVAKYKLPADLLLLSELPHSANGKILKHQLREMYLRQEKAYETT